MSNFPDFIKIRVINSGTGEPIPNIAVAIKLFAKHKNNYKFLLPISDGNGTIEISREWLIGNIKETANLFIMDYSSSLEDCYPRFEYAVWDEGAVQRAIRGRKLYQSALRNAQEEIDNLSKVDNSKYSPVTGLIELHGEKGIEATVQITPR